MKSFNTAFHRIMLQGIVIAGVVTAASGLRAAPLNPESDVTATPIKHVILIIGENRTFDNIFATFKPRRGQQVWNLLSEGIIKADGSPGPNFNQAQQWQALDSGTFSVHPDKTAVYTDLGPITTSGTPSAPYFSSVAQAMSVEPALPKNDYVLLTEGGSGLPGGSTIDPRFPANLLNGPFDLTQYLNFHDYSGSPVHRFFQMWQQVDCNVALATARNPSGCQNDLFPWVEATVGAGSNGKPQPADYDEPGHHEGAVAMSFYNVQQGDASYFNNLAHKYAVSDNFHQAVMGGTGANHLAIGFGTTIFYAGPDGKPAVPPANQIENPDAQPGTNNFYTQDGYSGGSYVECADVSQPGVDSVRSYLASLPYRVFRDGDCRKGALRREPSDARSGRGVIA